MVRPSRVMKLTDFSVGDAKVTIRQFKLAEDETRRQLDCLPCGDHRDADFVKFSQDCVVVPELVPFLHIVWPELVTL